MNRLRTTLFLAALAAFPVIAQDISGTIEGTVLDKSQGAIPKAKVTVTNVDRGLTLRELTTDTNGLFSAPSIPIGNYSVKVEAPGFKATTVSDIVLNVKDDRKLNITLEVGQVTESVDVREETTKVELSSVAVATVITGVQVRELPLGTRNYEQLVALMPGVTSSTTDELYLGVSSPSGLSATVPYSVNGNRTSANNWTVDGADNVDRGSNLTLLTFPSIDSIAEFKVQRSMYSADTGRAGGGQISVVTKSGTSQFHGDLYEFNRNDYLSANNWINNANRVNVVNGVAKVPPLRWNDFGGTLGGPVPMHKRGSGKAAETFFFFSEEARRIITYTTFQPTIPTTGMIGGTFPTPVCLTNNSPCTTTSTTIAPSLINPIAAQYIKDIFSKLPLNGTSTTSGIFPLRNLYNSDQQIARIDHSFTQTQSLWFKWERDSIPTTEPGGLFTGSTIPNGATTNTNTPGRAYVGHYTQIVKPTVVDDFGFNYTTGAIHAVPVGLTAKVNSPDINVPLPYANPEDVVPSVAITSGTSIVGYGKYNEYNRNYTVFNDISWQLGRHSLKFGVSVNRFNKTENAASGQGSFSFAATGAPTGTSSFTQSFANFLLGNVSSFTQPSADVTPDIWAWQTEAYAQDDFRISPRLTLSLGVRWSFFGQPTETQGLLSNFDPATYSAATAAKIDPTSGNIIASSITQPYTNGIIVAGKNSPFGSKIAPDNWHNFAPRIGIAWDPTGSGKTSIRTGYGVFYDATNMGLYETTIFRNPPFVQSVTYSNAPFDKISTGVVPGTVSTVFAKGTQLPNRTPYMQNWSFSLQRQLPLGVVLEGTYAGSKGTHLIGIVDINQAAPGVALAAGLHAAGGNTVFTTADDPRINAVRPFLGYNAINTIQSAFDSNYHSLQSNVRKQFRDVGLVSFAFTWSKNLTDSSSDSGTAPQSSYNWHGGEYGPATLDRQRVANLNYVYTIPMFSAVKGPAAYLLKGWQVSGIMSFYSGSAFTVTTSSVDPAGLGLLGNSASSSRPDMTCDPNASAPHTNAQWFTIGCFTPTPQGAIRPGNAGRGVVRGPGYENWDASLAKTFAIKERYKLQFRGEALNVLNHPNPNGFGSTNNTSSLFGTITTYRAPRRMQLGLKLEF